MCGHTVLVSKEVALAGKSNPHLLDFLHGAVHELGNRNQHTVELPRELDGHTALLVKRDPLGIFVVFADEVH